jgi:hypothetical protein
MARVRNRRYRVDPALAIECAVRQEVLGHSGVHFGHHVMSSAELRRISEAPVFPLYPFTFVGYYTQQTQTN